VDRILGIPTQHAGAVVVATLLVTLLFASRIVDFRTGEIRLDLDPSVDRLLPQGNEERAFFDHLKRQFGSREALIVALGMDDVFTFENLRTVQEVTERLEALDEVLHVVSLANALSIRSERGGMVVEPFLAQLEADPEVLQRIRRDVLGNPIYAGNLVSHDARATAVVVHLVDMPEHDFIAAKVDRRIARVAEEAAAGARVWITGPPLVKAETARLLLADLRRILPLATLIIAVIGYLSFRSLRGILVPTISLFVALVWTLGILAWLGVPLNLVTLIVPPLLVTLGFAYMVHVVSEYYQRLEEAVDPAPPGEGPVAEALRRVALPVALTGLTTIAGFLSLAISPFGAIREFGLISVAGIAITVWVALTFTPALLQILPGSGRPDTARRAGSGIRRRFDRFIEALGHFDVRRRIPILVAAASIALASLLGVSRIRVNSEIISNFPEHHRIRSDFAAINEHLEGANPFYIVIETAVPDAFVDPANLRILESFQEWLVAQPEVGGSTSLVDYVKLINRAFHDDDPEYLAVPETRGMTKQLLLFGGNNELSSYVNGNYETVNLHVRAKAMDTACVVRLVERIEQRLTSLPEYMHPRITGSIVLLSRAVNDVARGQVESLSLAFVFIFAILAGLFTSFRVGFLALLPNALPVVAYFGLLGLTGVTLDTTTGLVACIVLGIAVDDTIHLLARFNFEAREHVDEKIGVVFALKSVARPVTITTAGVCLGFLALTVSEFQNQVHFGILGALTLAFAWLVDVTFTPALCAGMRVVTLWDILTLDLGEDPQRSISLLRGLSKTQARMVALTTDIISFPACTSVFRVGDPGDEFYVLLDGEMRISIDTGDRRVELNRARYGDIVGEVALYCGKRTADVDTVTDVRALRFTRENLERLRRRHPRIGARVFWNLSEILADHVDNATRRVR